MSARLGVVLDGATERLIAAARATQAAEHLPKESARSLVALSRGARLYLKARQPRLSRRSLDEIDKLLAGTEDEDLGTAYVGLVDDVRKAIEGGR